MELFITILLVVFVISLVWNLYDRYVLQIKIDKLNAIIYNHIDKLTAIQSDVHDTMWDYWHNIESQIESLHTNKRIVN